MYMVRPAVQIARLIRSFRIVTFRLLPLGVLNDCDLENLYKLYFYQIAVCGCYGQYYASDADNREIYLKQTRLATRLPKNTDRFIS